MTRTTLPKLNHNALIEHFKEGVSGQSKKKDQRFFSIAVKKGNDSASAVIRFLPDKDSNKLNFRVIFKHYIKLGGQLYSAVCRQTIGEECPICKWTYAQGLDWAKANGVNRSKKFISNVLVIEHEDKDLVGRVFLYEYGPKIMSKLEAKLLNKKRKLVYFDYEDGANFEVNVTKNDGDFANYDNSEFLTPDSIADFLDEKNISVDEFIDAHFNLDEVIESLDIKSFKDLEKELNDHLAQVGFGSTTNVVKTEDAAAKSYAALSNKSVAEDDEELPQVKVKSDAPAKAEEEQKEETSTASSLRSRLRNKYSVDSSN